MKKSTCCNANCINKMENLTTFAVCTKCGRECGEITPEQDNWKEEFKKQFVWNLTPDNHDVVAFYNQEDRQLEFWNDYKIINFIESLLSSQAHALKEQRCTRCNGTFLDYQHKHITRNGIFHTNCYKVNNLGYEQGKKEMKEQMKTAVPEENDGSMDYYSDGFNECRKQTLTAIESIEI